MINIFTNNKLTILYILSQYSQFLRLKMKTYTLTQTRNQHGKVFDKAKVEPVLITKQKTPTHVIISAETYKQLIVRLEELEDLNLGKIAQTALNKSSIVGSEDFTATLETIANA